MMGLDMSNNNSIKSYLKQASHLIDNWLDLYTYYYEIPGVSVGIFVEDEVIFQKEYGYANLENKIKLTSQHLFRIASHSKLFTATAIMKLYDQGKLSIDDKVLKHLPWFTSDKDDNLEHITIRNLLTHSSGLTSDGITAHWYNHQFPKIDEVKNQIKEGASFFKSSELFKYSNFGFTILGQIIESVSGLTYQEFLQKEIFDPLDLNQTVVDVDESNIANHADGYGIKYPKKKREKMEHVPANSMHAATGLSSTVNDLIKFYQAHFLGNDVLVPDNIKREMQRTQFKVNNFDRGLGFRNEYPSGLHFTGHSGGYPGFSTRSGLVQDKKIIIVALTNARDGPAENIVFSLINMIGFVIKQKDKLFPKQSEKLPNLKEVIGVYINEYGVNLFSQIGSKLVLAGPGVITSSDSIFMLEHKEKLVFTFPRVPYTTTIGEDIEFIDGPDGKKIFVDAHKGQSIRFEFSY
jgi:CubicO group peptidase (beta-lactamase class C family)